MKAVENISIHEKIFNGEYILNEKEYWAKQKGKAIHNFITFSKSVYVVMESLIYLCKNLQGREIQFLYALLFNE